MRIQQLAPEVANQIAAGEVIDRPASVLKELLENALDAGADSIHVDIAYGGLNLIKVSDNGSGILAEDLPLALKAHATSKLRTLDDLYELGSMGFRGEALASIASVAKVAISSRPASQEQAMSLEFHPSQYKLIPCARKLGTTITVQDLFYNAPVRKRFLNNEKIEFQAIEKLFKVFALSAPWIQMSLKHNNQLILSLPAALTEQAKQRRIAKILGSVFIKKAIYLETTQGGLALSGWISQAEYQRSQNDRQWVYLNQRMIKDKLINHALKQAYEGILHPGRFPVCLLYLTVPGSEVDINVHPAKYEVRFQQPRLIHDFLTVALAQALNKDLLHFENPNKELSAMAVKEPFLPFNGRSSSSTAFRENPFFIPAPEAQQPWLVLHAHYVLMWLDKQPYLIDFHALYQKWVLNLLIQNTFPLESRPLLVPVDYPLPMNNLFFPSPPTGGEGAQRADEGILSELHLSSEQLNLLQQGLEEFGINNTYRDHKLSIHSIPLLLPYLNLSAFIKAVSQLRDLNRASLQTLIAETQSINPEILSTAERKALSDFWMQEQRQNELGLSKALTPEQCRRFLYE